MVVSVPSFNQLFVACPAMNPALVAMRLDAGLRIQYAGRGSAGASCNLSLRQCFPVIFFQRLTYSGTYTMRIKGLLLIAWVVSTFAPQARGQDEEIIRKSRERTQRWRDNFRDISEFANCAQLLALKCGG